MNEYSQLGTSQAGRGMSAYSALGQLIEMYVHAKWSGFGMKDDELDGIPAIVTNQFAEGMSVKVPGAEKELLRLERDIKKLNKRYYERLMKLGEGRCLMCGEDRGGQSRYCACCPGRMTVEGT